MLNNFMIRWKSRLVLSGENYKTMFYLSNDIQIYVSIVAQYVDRGYLCGEKIEK